MNSHSQARRYYAEEFDDAPIKVPAFVFAAAAILGVAAVCLGCMYLGAWMQAQVTPEPGVKIITLQPRPALTQWQCTKQEFAEYREACKQRAVSSLTKPKE